MWRTHATRFAEIVGAWSLLTIFNFLFACVLYPLVIFQWGSLVGGGTMAVLASTICLFLIWWYSHTGKDWLGVNVVEDIKTNGEGWVGKLDTKAQESIIWFLLRFVLYLPSRFFLVVLWAIKKNDVLAFIALNVAQDPFVTTVFLRHGRFGGLTKKDWIVFCGSLVFSNGYWIARSVALIEIIKFGWCHIVQS
jgi:hypothetical protein